MRSIDGVSPPSHRDAPHNSVDDVEVSSPTLDRMWFLQTAPFNSTQFNHQLDGCALLFIDFHVNEFRYAANVFAFIPKIARSPDQRLDSLVENAGTHSLHFRVFMLANNPCNRPSYPRCAGVCRH